ncbi:hypothetical protein Hanom_Chr16g01492501 [Helianthus anomalus]
MWHNTTHFVHQKAILSANACVITTNTHPNIDGEKTRMPLKRVGKGVTPKGKSRKQSSFFVKGFTSQKSQASLSKKIK